LQNNLQGCIRRRVKESAGREKVFYLTELRGYTNMSVWEDILDRLEQVRITIIGDIVLDHYIWGEVDRISPEAPIPVVQVIRETYTLGGAANVANNIRSLGGDVDLCGVIGEDSNGGILLDLLKKAGIRTRAVVSLPGRATTIKSRVIAHRQQVVRVDREISDLIPGPIISGMKTQIGEILHQADAIILEDYGKGVINPILLEDVIQWARQAGKITTVDPKTDHFDYYRGVTAITPNRQEAEEAAFIKIRDEASLHQAGQKLLQSLKCKGVLITLGEQGMCLFEEAKPPLKIPTHAREVFDVSGAGDTVIAAFTAALVAGANMQEAAILSNLAGGIVVEKLGTATVTREEIRSRLVEIRTQ
jgi:D-beta-D-heptose 7-phosphate kinase/D-beta-D-heptose 1-phosphate adenosyltransferase